METERQKQRDSNNNITGLRKAQPLGAPLSLTFCTHFVACLLLTLGAHPLVIPEHRKVNYVLACLKMSLSVPQA